MIYGWTNSSRAKKCVPLDDNCVYQERKVQSWKNLYFLDRIPFLDLRSEGLSNLATLSEPRFARSDNRSALLDISPSSLRSRKEKSNRGKKSSSSFVFLYRPYYVTRKEDIFSIIALKGYFLSTNWSKKVKLR